MRRISLAFALTALLLAAPSAAFAADHRMKISEVLLSDGGDDAIQYVELSNTSTDGLPGTYYLGIYNADGEPVGTVSIAEPMKPITLISTAEADAAFDVTGDDVLTVALPANGQVCFERLPSAKIACTSWGCINTVVTGPYETAAGAPPPDGQALQRQVIDMVVSYTVGEPTPDAANVTGAPSDACSTDPDAGPSIDAGGDGDADAGPDGPDGGGGGGGDGGGDDDDSGCGCGVSGGGGAAPTLGLSAAVLLFAFRRRRRA